MPYKRVGTKVVKADTGKLVPGGQHKTESQAQKHLIALNINVKHGKSKR